MQETTPGDAYENVVRLALRQLRQELNLSFRAQARAINMPLSWLHEFDRGKHYLQQPVMDRAKRGIGEHCPKALPALIRLSLLWSESGAVSPAEDDDTGPAESGRAPPGPRSS